jgi:hypothetical protein
LDNSLTLTICKLTQREKGPYKMAKCDYQPIGDLLVTDTEYRCAINLSRLSDLPEEQSNEYWQLCRYYRGQIHTRSDVEKAIKRLRCEQ